MKERKRAPRLLYCLPLLVLLLTACTSFMDISATQSLHTLTAA
ncbi:MAG: hypothetical protein AB7D92_03860 [Sphaerochaeta sp.]